MEGCRLNLARGYRTCFVTDIANEKAETGSLWVKKKRTTRLSSVGGSLNSGARTANLAVVDALAAPDMLLKYSLHEP